MKNPRLCRGLIIVLSQQLFHVFLGGQPPVPVEAAQGEQAVGVAACDRRAELIAGEAHPKAHLPQQAVGPFGQLTEGADGLLREMGFRVSLTCNELRSAVTSGDPDSLFSLGRFNRDGRLTTEEYMKKLLG